MTIKRLIWDGWNITHIARHHVKPEEVEQTCKSKNLFTKGKGGLYKLVGQTDDGRYLTILLAPRPAGSFYPVTARDADDKEKRRFKNEKS